MVGDAALPTKISAPRAENAPSGKEFLFIQTAREKQLERSTLQLVSQQQNLSRQRDGVLPPYSLVGF